MKKALKITKTKELNIQFDTNNTSLAFCYSIFFFFFFFAEKLSLSVVFYKILWIVGATCARVSNRVAVSSVILISLSFLPQTTGRKAKQQLKTLAGAF